MIIKKGNKKRNKRVKNVLLITPQVTSVAFASIHVREGQ